MLGKIHALGLICIEILLLSAKASAQSFPWATTISRTGWKVTADSYQAGSEPEKVLDSNTSTIWQTQYSPELASLPHYIQVDSKFELTPGTKLPPLPLQAFFIATNLFHPSESSSQYVLNPESSSAKELRR